MPDRIAVLETQVQTLMTRHQGMESQFKEFSAQNAQQMSSMQTQINTQRWLRSEDCWQRDRAKKAWSDDVGQATHQDFALVGSLPCFGDPGCCSFGGPIS